LRKWHDILFPIAFVVPQIQYLSGPTSEYRREDPTVGLWVLRSAATYPEVMRRELSRLRSNATIKVINSGRIGDTIPNSIARFERDVFAHTPDLVVWQLGTNDVAWVAGRTKGSKEAFLKR
jgi:acyl-CoA thioesterase-1